MCVFICVCICACVCVIFFQTVIVTPMAQSVIAVMAQDIVNVRRALQGPSVGIVWAAFCGTMAANVSKPCPAPTPSPLHISSPPVLQSVLFYLLPIFLYLLLSLSPHLWFVFVPLFRLPKPGLVAFTLPAEMLGLSSCHRGIQSTPPCPLNNQGLLFTKY